MAWTFIHREPGQWEEAGHVPRVDVGELSLSYLEHGSGENAVLAVHGNLGCADWLGLVLPLLPQSLRVIAAEWRGCGESDKPEPASDYSNYSMRTHAGDMRALLDALGIQRCHLYGHSTGGIICSHMLAEQPERFGKVLLLDPVTPLGLQLAPGQIGVPNPRTEPGALNVRRSEPR